MKKFIKQLQIRNLINRVQNKFYIRIGLYFYSIIEIKLNVRKIDDNYIKKVVDMGDVELLKNYSIKYRGYSHYHKNILPRLKQNKRYKGFAIVDQLKNEIAYLSWVDFDRIIVPEIEYNRNLLANEAYFFDDHCVAQHQRKGLHEVVFNERLSYCSKMGIDGVYIVIYMNNFKALQNLRKYNFKLKNIFWHYPILKTLNQGKS